MAYFSWLSVFVGIMLFVGVLSPQTKEREELLRIFGGEEEMNIHFGMVTKVIKSFFKRNLEFEEIEEMMLLRMEEKLSKLREEKLGVEASATGQSGGGLSTPGSSVDAKEVPALNAEEKQGPASNVDGKQTPVENVDGETVSKGSALRKFVEKIKNINLPEVKQTLSPENLKNKADNFMKKKVEERNIANEQQEAEKQKKAEEKIEAEKRQYAEKKEKERQQLAKKVEILKKKGAFLEVEFLQNKARHEQEDQEKKERNENQRKAFENIYYWLNPECKISLFGRDLVKQWQREHILRQKIGDMGATYNKLDQTEALDEKENEKFLMAKLYDRAIGKRLEQFEKQYTPWKAVNKAKLEQYRQERDMESRKLLKTEKESLEQEEKVRRQKEIEDEKAETVEDGNYFKLLDEHNKNFEALKKQKKECKDNQQLKNLNDKIASEKNSFLAKTQPYWDYKSKVKNERRMRRQEYKQLQESLSREGVRMLARQYFLQFNPSLLPKKIKKILQASSGRRESLPTNCAISDDDVFQSVAEDSKEGMTNVGGIITRPRLRSNSVPNAIDSPHSLSIFFADSDSKGRKSS